MEDIKLEESLDFVDAIDFANNLHPYEEDGSTLWNLAKNTAMSVGKNVAHAFKKGWQDVGNTARAGLQNAANNIQQKQASKDLDNKLENLANSLSKLLTNTAVGDLQKDADKAKAASAEADNVKRNANKELQNAEKDAKGGGDKGAQV